MDDAKNSLLFGANPDTGLVAVEHVHGRDDARDEMLLFVRHGDETLRVREPFRPFIAADIHAIGECPVPYEAEPLAGEGRLNLLALFPTWKACQKAKAWLASSTGKTPSSPAAPFMFVNDPVQQHLMLTGRTLFKGMTFEAVRRMQVDIECTTTEGYDFCNAEREGDAIIAIAMSDQTGWVEVLSGTELDEKDLLKQFVARVSDRDPDVLEGHNIFNFDLPYIAARAKRHGVTLKLGRDGSTPTFRPSRFSAGERTLAYSRCDIFGRHVVDTLFMVHAYDISHRSLDGFGLKTVAIHFGLAAPDRTYIPGGDIARTYRESPELVMRYVADDATETRAVSNLLSRSYYVQARMLPFAYQSVCVRGTATKIDALMIREYLHRRHALPMPDGARAFAGGYTDMFATGVIRNVHHCDVRSLYPSLMLVRRLGPRSDALGIFLSMLDDLRTFRLKAKTAMRAAKTDDERNHHDALQATFKVLINSFYGYLGFSQARFSDFDAAEAIAEGGRTLLGGMIDWLNAHGARPIEIDTDGIYFVPPVVKDAAALDSFRQAFLSSLPEGIELEFDGEYVSMYSYKMKNYALLEASGEVIIKGAALKSRGLEPFQRDFLRETIRYKLEGRDDELPALRDRYVQAIENGKWPIEKLAKTEQLQDSPAAYSAKQSKGSRGRGAAYELALRSEREYRAGDQISYYVTGTKKSVAVHENARLVSEWNANARDENIPYYVAKLEALYAKFAESTTEAKQGEFDL